MPKFWNTSTMTSLYCLKCKKKTDTSNAHQVVVKGRNMVKGNCTKCGTKKSQFVGNGLLFGPNSPFNGIPLLGKLL